MDKNFFVEPTAVIDDGVTIGEGTRIWHFCHVMTGATIGADCVLGQNVFVGKGVRIGAGVKIQNNVSVFSGVELHDNVFVGPSVVFTNIKRPRSFIDQKERFVSTIVCKGATIGANATVLCGTNLGEFCMVGAGSTVVDDVHPYELVIGNPARRVGWVDVQGREIQFEKDDHYWDREGKICYILRDGKVTCLDT